MKHRPARWLTLLIDSAGITSEGEREWNVRKHGGPKRLVWCKIHIGIDEETPEIRAVEVTTSDVVEAAMLPDLLEQSRPNQATGLVMADGAYDTRRCHDAIAAKFGRDLHFQNQIPKVECRGSGFPIIAICL